MFEYYPMAYLALARKYRPRNFSQVIGQVHILKTLSYALETQQLHHAYLLTGTRGVGKTSLARILAKCFNCETGITASPCETCSNCQEITQGNHMDVIEIDAASRTKVEDTRELLENVQYAPQKSRFKVYIIDEVHMLSTHSFNALLKTLEEPPTHVKFILATTDPQKLLPTVLSRCLQCHLKNISTAHIADQLAYILQQENIPQTAYEKPALTRIATAAQGSMRDALSLLDQCLAHGNGTVLENNVFALLGGIREEKITALLDNIHTRQIPALLSLTEELEETGTDFFMALDALLSYLQKLTVLQFTNPSHNEKFKAETLQLYYQIALLGKRDLPLAPDPKAGFIMTIIRMAVFTPVSTIPPAEMALPSSMTTPPPADFSTRQDTTQDTSPPHRESDSWTALVNQLNLSGLAKLLAQNCTLLQQQDNHIQLSLESSQAALFTEAAKGRLTDSLEKYYQKPYRVSISIEKSSSPQTSARLQTLEISEKTKALQATLLSDKAVQSLIQTFSAELITDTQE